MNLLHLPASLAALIFLAFGIWMMRVAYWQNNPIVFLAVFFSSSLIILISAACLTGLVLRLASSPEKQENEGVAPENDNQAD